jgi:hypothetical protein
VKFRAMVGDLAGQRMVGQATDQLEGRSTHDHPIKPSASAPAGRVRERCVPLLAPKAKESQGARTDLQPSDSRTAKVAAIGTGYSGSTLRL